MPPRASAHPYLKRLGARIRQLREVKGWTQERLAAEADVDRSYAHGLEHGRRNITVLKLRDVARALGVEMSAFFETD